MRHVLAMALALFSCSALSDPTIFKMTLGKTTEEQMKAIYRAEHTGTNKYSDGNMYSVSPSEIGFDGLQDVTVIFNSKGVLNAVIATFPKSKFNYLNQLLGEKYKLVRKNIPFVGDSSATYRDGETEITLNAPHLSFELSMSYIQDDFMKSFNDKSEAEQQQKQKSEASQL